MTPVNIILVAAWAAAYVFGMLNKREKADGTRRIPLWTKLVMIAVVLGIAALSWPWPSRKHIVLYDTTAAALLVIGLVADAIGDLVLADVFPLKQSVIPAIGVFGIGHIAYILAVLTLRNYAGLEDVYLLPTAVISGVLAILGWRLLVYNPKGSQTLNMGSLIYGILLFVTTGLAVGLSIEARARYLLSAGLVLFTVSDMFLAQSLIRKRSSPLLRDIVWIIYSGGQLLIAFSVGPALRTIALISQ